MCVGASASESVGAQIPESVRFEPRRQNPLDEERIPTATVGPVVRWPERRRFKDAKLIGLGRQRLLEHDRRVHEGVGCDSDNTKTSARHGVVAAVTAAEAADPRPPQHTHHQRLALCEQRPAPREHHRM